ncbi:hypothetical protein [Methylocystis suflitae]|uniref:hypothetical protein n=1 Tax=Methylocystis suflitae TaxID=2951405 RepID=UPI00210DD0C8|nr:hypothetical protein [Methylocystis suflitae]MCQ4188577.1 hypothetical protein [Methylocystis suflitae]
MPKPSKKPSRSNALQKTIVEHMSAHTTTDVARCKGESEDQITRLFRKEFELLEAICDAPCADDREFFDAAGYLVNHLEKEYGFDPDEDQGHDCLLKRMLLNHLTSRRESKTMRVTLSARPGA